MGGRTHHTKKRGSFAVGECGRSGQKMLLKNMIEDGYYPGLLVHPAWYEPRHPQEDFKAVYDDPALRHPMPENNMINHTVRFPLFDLDTCATVPPAVATFGVGRVSFPFVSGEESTFSAGTGIGAVSPENIDSESTFSTGTILIIVDPGVTGEESTFSAGTVVIDIDHTFWSSDTWTSGTWGN